MDIVIDISPFERFIHLAPDEMFWVFFVNVGWLILAGVFLYGAREVYLFYIRNKWAENHKNILLAIDIPKGNEQTPKAVENMFTYLSGAHGSISFYENWFEGKFQKSFSYEIVSLEGYTQFLIWTPIEYRNLVESSVYSQYPDAEISEVDDYTKLLPANLPDEEYDVWGTEFIQKGDWVLPIKTYPEFLYQMGPLESQFKDPMASLMDLCSSLRQGEQLWIQHIVIPIGFDWVKTSEAAIDAILGRKKKAKEGWFYKFIVWLGDLSESVYSIWGEIEGGSQEEKPKMMVELSPQEAKRANSIQLKSSKLSFEVKIRVVYVGKRDVMNKAKVANGMVGYMKQFAALDLNNLKPDVDMTFTKAQYFFQQRRLEARKRKIYSAYVGRSDGQGRNPGIYNIEELATLWHFPVEASVKAAMIQKAPGRKADAPAALPLEQAKAEPLPEIFRANQSGSGTKKDSQPDNSDRSTGFEEATDLQSGAAAPPENLPFA